MEDIHDFLITKLNQDVVWRFIYPYSMSPQPSKLMRDIRTLHSDMGIIDTLYTTQYNYRILHTDLAYFVNNPLIHTCSSTPRDFTAAYAKPAYLTLFKRFRGYSEATDNELQHLRDIFFSTKFDEDSVNRDVRILLAILTPEERTEFIEKYILNNPVEPVSTETTIVSAYDQMAMDTIFWQ